MNASGFQHVLDHIRSEADSEAHKGRLFERLMQTYFREDPLYKDRFSEVWLWSEWARRTGFDGHDTGIDLVAAERVGGGGLLCNSVQVLRARHAHLEGAS